VQGVRKLSSQQRAEPFGQLLVEEETHGVRPQGYRGCAARVRLRR
jgi:hypothetical protein